MTTKMYTQSVWDNPVGLSVAQRKILLFSLCILFFTLLALYCACLSVLLPNQIQTLYPENKTTMLAIIFAITSVFSTLATPISGALSDRTRTTHGRRTPWIIAGSVIGGLSLAVVPFMDELFSITVFWLFAAISLNCMQPAVTAIVADRFPLNERGMASGFVGAGMTAGCPAGVAISGLMADQLTLAYWAFSIAIIVVSLAFILLNPEPRQTYPEPKPFQFKSFFSGFWISPKKHPDFAWAFLGRFTIYMGYQGIVTYLLYIMQDYIGLSQSDANTTMAKVSGITLVGLIVSGFFSGWLSDRIGRRKPLVFIASILMATAISMPLISPTVQGMLLYGAIIGIGYGAFMSVDLALMTQVLPNKEGSDTGKDLGILTTAVNIPQILSPVLAAWLLSMTENNYQILFVVALVFVTSGAFFVWFIRSVR